MPAGGTWTAQNKIRPGAYINFIYKAKQNLLTVGARGVVAVATDLSWGPDNEIITVTASQMLTGKSLPLVGVVADDSSESLPLRLALASATTALVYRANPGGKKAKVEDTTTGYTVEAKYPGTLGNKITVVILEDTPTEDQFTINVLVDGLKKESFIVTTAESLAEIDSDFVTISADAQQSFTGTGSLLAFQITGGASSINSVKVDGVAVTDYGFNPTTSTVTLKTAPAASTTILISYVKPLVASAGLTPTGGTNGTELSDFTDFFESLKYKTFNAIAVDSSLTTVATQIVNWVRDMRENQGRKIVGVVCDKNTVDYEGIISVNQGFKNDVDTVTTQLFSLYVASLSAGAAVNESLTCREITEATEIINPIDEADIDAALQTGKFILTYRQDGKVVIEKDINTLQSFTADKGYPFSKNRVVRCLDEIGNSVALKFTQNYAGKVDNNDEGRALFKSEIINLMDTLQNMGAIQNFQSSDVTVYQGDDIDNVVVDLTIQPVDAMEKLYMTVYVSA